MAEIVLNLKAKSMVILFFISVRRMFKQMYFYVMHRAGIKGEQQGQSPRGSKKQK
jgi:hypothetical protein